MLTFWQVILLRDATTPSGQPQHRPSVPTHIPGVSCSRVGGLDEEVE